MRISSSQLVRVSTCPKKYFLEKQPQYIIEPAREVIKRIFLSQGLGRDSKWGIDRIASMWDQLFWEGREVTQENIDKSARGILATKQLYSRLPQANFEAYSSKTLELAIDSSLIITSSGDFILCYENKIETWIYLDLSQRQVRRSLFPAVEHLLIQRAIRGAYSKDFYLVVYHTTINKMRPTYFKVRDHGTETENRNIALSAANIIKKKISYPIQSTSCDNCPINC